MAVQMIYPERRNVSEHNVIRWAQDELVNAVIQHKTYENDLALDADIARVHASGKYSAMTIDEAKYILEDAGACTFAASPRRRTREWYEEHDPQSLVDSINAANSGNPRGT